MGKKLIVVDATLFLFGLQKVVADPIKFPTGGDISLALLSAILMLFLGALS